MKNLIKLAIAAVVTACIFPMTAISGEGYRGLSIGIIANEMDLNARGTEYEGINSPSSNTKGLDKDDIAGYKETKSFDFPSAFIEYRLKRAIWSILSSFFIASNSFGLYLDDTSQSNGKYSNSANLLVPSSVITLSCFA